MITKSLKDKADHYQGPNQISSTKCLTFFDSFKGDKYFFRLSNSEASIGISFCKVEHLVYADLIV